MIIYIKIWYNNIYIYIYYCYIILCCAPGPLQLALRPLADQLHHPAVATGSRGGTVVIGI